MPIARQRGICHASNAFNIVRFVSNVFLDAARGHRQRCFSNRTALYAVAGYAMKDESDQRVGQVRSVSDENTTSALSFNPIEARAARKMFERQRINAKLQASLDPTSLEKTLEKHRAVNTKGLIEYVPVDENVEDFTRPKTFARRAGRRKRKPLFSEKSSADKEDLELHFEEHGDWFEHLNVSTVLEASKRVATQTPKEEKADKIIKSKTKQTRIGSVLEYKGKYVNPISNAKLDRIQLPWVVAVNEATTAIERYDQTHFYVVT